jgi:hypothetical protein
MLNLFKTYLSDNGVLPSQVKVELFTAINKINIAAAHETAAYKSVLVII